jgi:hypothetical protein
MVQAGGRALPHAHGARFSTCPVPRVARAGVGARPGRPTTVTPPRAEADYQPSRLGMTIGVGLAMQINAAVFAACYQVLPFMQLTAGRVEEVEPRWAYLCMVKLGTLLSSPVDLLLLTIALSIIELLRLLAGGDE